MAEVKSKRYTTASGTFRYKALFHASGYWWHVKTGRGIVAHYATRESALLAARAELERRRRRVAS